MDKPSEEELLAARVRLPQHIVHRDFVAETVVLNLRTGKYHGLNPTAGRMLGALEQAPSVGSVIPDLAHEYGQEQAQIERDLIDLCAGLLERGLIEIVDEPGTG
jgi:Coenzyme PQQ synthesis protein D (PqqD)